LTPLNPSPPAIRARDRHRRVVLSALASALARGISALTLLIAVPLVLNYLGDERYGLWITITSLTLGLSFVDLGLGNGLVNAVAEAHGKDKPALARTYISSAFFLLVTLSVSLGVLFLLLQRWVPWPRVFNVSSSIAMLEAGPAAVAFVGCLLLNAPLGIVQRVQSGYQRGFDNSLWQAIGSLLGLGGLLAAIQLGAGLPWLVLAVAGLPLLATFIQACVLFGWRHPELRPRRDAASPEAARKILRMGSLFFVLQLAAAVAFASDNLVVAQVLGTEAVADYAITLQLFSLPMLVLGTLFTPLWPAYGEAVTRGDVIWVQQTLKRSLLLAALVAGLPSVLLVLWGVPLIHWWAGPSITPPFWLLLGLATWAVLQALGNAVAMFLNGASVIRLQVICATLLALVGLPAKIILAGTFGLPGIAWGTALAYSVLVAAPYLVAVPRILRLLPAASPAGARHG
jgi:O-antigen/teichoic acid export membrane protein